MAIWASFLCSSVYTSDSSKQKECIKNIFKVLEQPLFFKSIYDSVFFPFNLISNLKMNYDLPHPGQMGLDGATGFSSNRFILWSTKR